MEAYLTEIVMYLAAQSWQIAVLTVAVAVATFALRHRSAHVRYLLWLIVIAKCLVPPLHTVPLTVLTPPRGDIPIPLEPQGEVLNLAPYEIVPLPIAAERIRGTPIPAPQVLRVWIVVWLTGAGVYLAMNLLRALRGHYWLRRTRRPIPIDSHTDTLNLLRACGARRLPRIWIMEGVGQPFVWGLLRGSIYVPPAFFTIENTEHRRSILAHELSHVLRFDAAVNAIQILAQGIFWFHPFVWWANRMIRREREKCCDEMVIARLCTTPKNYSTAILETLARARESARPVPSLAVAGPLKSIEGRIRTMLRPGKRFHGRPSLIAATVILLIALAAVPTTLVLTARAKEPMTLPVPLAQFPRTLNGWMGEDVTIPAIVKEYMQADFADDFLNRRYTNEAARQWADLYVVYSSSRPSGILGHQPLRTYPANGWIWDQTAPVHVTTSSNRLIDCVTHRFHLSVRPQNEVVVLSFYIIDGSVVNEQDFVARLASFSQRPPRYVAQVQFTSTLEDSARSAASALADTVLDSLPDRNGVVNAASIQSGEVSAQSTMRVSTDSPEPGQPRVAARPFNSEMAFDVFVQETLPHLPDLDPAIIASGPKKRIGHTPGAAPVAIPAGRIWWVLPSVPVQDWNRLIRELDANGVPGLMLPMATDSDMEHLAGLSHLKYLDLVSPQITDAGLAPLRNLTQLERLSLPVAKVTDTGLAHLAGMTSLQVLDVSYTQITDAGIAHLTGMVGLRCLSVQGDPITDTGMANLRGLTKLQFLDLLKTQITDAGLAHLAGLSELQALLLGSPRITGPGLAYLKDLPRLRGLVLANTQVTDASLASLADLKGLQGLTLSGAQITDAGIAHLRGITELCLLELDNTQITDAGLTYLGDLPQLQWLNLTGDKITDAGLEHLKNLAGLKHLTVQGKQITDAGREKLKETLPNLIIE